MTRVRENYQLCIAAACLAFAVVSALVTFGELSPFLRPHANSRDRVEAILSAPVMPGLSGYGNTMQQKDCLDGIASAYGMAQTSGERARLIETCETLALAILKAEPSNSYAWFSAALAAAEAEKRPEFNSRYMASRETAPNELWLASLRVNLANSRTELLNDATWRAYSSDIATIVSSRSGIRSVARLYVDRPEFRDRVVAVVETLPMEDQKRFLATVKKEVDALK